MTKPDTSPLATDGNGARKDMITGLIKDALGGGDSAGSKAAGFGVMLAAIWMILDWQGGAIRSEVDSVRRDIGETKNRIVDETQLRRDRMQMEIESSISAVRHEVVDMRAFSDKERKECHERIERIIKTDESLQKQIVDLQEMVRAMRQIEKEHKAKEQP